MIYIVVHQISRFKNMKLGLDAHLRPFSSSQTAKRAINNAKGMTNSNTFEPRNSFPLNIVLEEAHGDISNDPISVFGSANKIFERIAGRIHREFRVMAEFAQPGRFSLCRKNSFLLPVR